MTQSSSRRTFLGSSLWLAAGVAAGCALPRGAFTLWAQEAKDKEQPPAPPIDARLQQLGLELPEVRPPAATYVPAVQVGHLLFTSGHGPRRADGTAITGKVGADLTLAQGQEAARRVALAILATARHTLGSLDKIVRVVKVLGMVNAAPDFTGQSQVINGFSDLLVDVFGKQNGTAARSAVGMGSLPGGIAVEIEAIFEVRT